MKSKIAFHLGRVFTLSLAELFSVFKVMKLNFRIVDLYREVLIIETEASLDVQKLQKRLGGTIKIMKVVDSLGRKKFLGPSGVFKDYFDSKVLKEKFLVPHSGKVQIGISLYPMTHGLALRGETKRLGLEIKRVLTAAGMSVRVVFPEADGLSLPSVVVGNEHILEKGAEIDFLIGEERIYVAKTLSIQNFEDYGRRDYQRPARDTRIGLLPPKVAQIMINLAEIPNAAISSLKSAILDPFVGSGTIVQEAMLMGFKGVGADVSEKAIEAADKNLEWIKNRYRLSQGRFELLKCDVALLGKNLPNYEYEAIITEGTLGPAYADTPSEKEMEKNFKDLEKIYLSAFKAFKKILPKEKRIIIALPAYRLANSYKFMPIVDKIEKLGYTALDPLPEILLEQFNFLVITSRKSMIYDRKDQFVSREIFIFTNN
ncbi:MAG: DNA methyltransferase [bacterium]|nr:DNA methyltransferase [bacterium]